MELCGESVGESLGGPDVAHQNLILARQLQKSFPAACAFDPAEALAPAVAMAPAVIPPVQRHRAPAQLPATYLLLAPKLLLSQTPAVGPDFHAAGPDFEAVGPDIEATGPDVEASSATSD